MTSLQSINYAAEVRDGQSTSRAQPAPSGGCLKAETIKVDFTVVDRSTGFRVDTARQPTLNTGRARLLN
jgi:hypothetical protein